MKIESLLLLAMATLLAGQSAPSWSSLNYPATFSADATILMTDGTVMVHQSCAPNWFKFTPNSSGNYVNGTWSQAASLPPGYAPENFSSALLADGRLVVIGGEGNGLSGKSCIAGETNLGAIYDPVANTWTPLPAPAGWAHIGDAPNTVLPDGSFLLANATTGQIAKLDPVTLTWTNLQGKSSTEEEGWTLLPDGSVLAVDVASAPRSERYFPQTDTWAPAGNTVASLVTNNEIGPQVLRPDGTVFVAGATGHTAVYSVATGTWAAGPDFPLIGGAPLGVNDGPATLLPSGNVLVGASPLVPPGHFNEFFEFDGLRLNPVPAPLGADSDATYNTWLLLLPTGQVLYTSNHQDPISPTSFSIYTPAGAPNPAWAPSINTAPAVVQPGQSYAITGTQLNGLSQAVGYGDDFQAATNYPLVRITNTASGHVFYCRTHNHSTMAVATGTALVSTEFDIPLSIETGPSTLVVVANGIASGPKALTVLTGQTQYKLTIAASPPAGGKVIPTGGVYSYDPAAVVGITAIANAGYSFTGWSGSVANASSTSTSVVMNAAETVVANFKAINTTPTSVTIQTNPSGLQFSVDGGAARVAPQTLSLLQGVHTLSVPTPQPVMCSGYGYSAIATLHHEYVMANATSYTVTLAGSWPTLAAVSSGGQVTDPNGYDICFANAANQALNWEIESYTGTTGSLVAHVLLGSISSTADTNFLMYYGNSAVHSFQGRSVGSAWTNATYPYAGIWHFGNGTVLNGSDSSANGNDLTNFGAAATAGQIGGGARFGSAIMTAAASTSLDFSGPVSFSFWENPTALGNPVLSSRTACTNGNWQIYDEVGTGLYFNFWSGASNLQAPTNIRLTLGAWSQVVITFDGSLARFYVNGSLISTVPLSGTRSANPNTFNVGTDSCSHYLQGSLDELRIAAGAWPSTLIQTMYNNQSNPGVFVTLSQMAPGDRASAPAGSQYTFVNWSDGGAATHSVNVLDAPATYTATFNLQPSAPMIGSLEGGGLSVPPVTAISANGYFTIFGQSLNASGSTRQLQSSDIVNGSLPETMASTCVNVGSARAFLTYVSPTQINAIAPAVPVGQPPAVTVVANCGAANPLTSTPVQATVAPASSEFLSWLQTANGQNPVMALDAVHGDYIGPPNLISGLTFRPAKAGDILTIYGIGFGSTASGPVPGLVPTAADSVPPDYSVMIGTTAAPASYVGITPGSAGLYQVNVMIPQGITPGNYSILLNVNGVSTPLGAFLTIG
jgi:uncharacterized protein (TIGR03437 family)